MQPVIKSLSLLLRGDRAISGKEYTGFTGVIPSGRSASSAVHEDTMDAAATNGGNHFWEVCAPLPARISLRRPGCFVCEGTQLITASPEGAYFGSNEEINVREELEISIIVPQSVFSSFPPAKLTGRATVVAVNKQSPPSGKKSGIGVRFAGRLAFHTNGERLLFSDTTRG